MSVEPGSDYERCFVSDSLLGALTWNNPPGQGVFHSGEHKRTYVTYMDHEFFTRVTFYDHESARWAEPVRVDDCRYPDGHNAPEILVTADGFIHLFYGCHDNPIKYARSRGAENISQWQLGMEIGEKMTYPNPSQMANGDILLFGRYWRSDDVSNCSLKLFVSADQGDSWNEGKELVRLGDEHWCYIREIVYDPKTNLVHLALRDRYCPVEYADGESGWEHIYYVRYDPASGVLLGLDGSELGRETTAEAMIEAKSRLMGQDSRQGSAAQCGDGYASMWVHDGVAYFILCDQTAEQAWFASCGDKGVQKTAIPQEMSRSNGQLYTEDGKQFEYFAVEETDPSTEFIGGDLLMWSSDDGGQRWGQGRRLIDRREIGRGLHKHSTTIVRNYSGAGPKVLFQVHSAEKKQALPEVRPYLANYMMPYRWNVRIFALDGQYKYVSNLD